MATKFAPRDYLAGKFLIAMPSMGDPRFAETVILLCAHNDQHAMGIVLNRPAEGVTLASLLDELEIEPTQELFEDRPVLAGGPVEPQRGFVLHTDDYESPTGTIKVRNGVSLSATHDVLRAIASEEPPRRSVLSLGYAGWGPGQLEDEMQANAWLHGPADPEIIFSDDHGDKWRRALGLLGVTDAMFSREWAEARGGDAHLH